MNATWRGAGIRGAGPTRAQTWADGYVVDTPYFEPVTTDVCPAWLSMISVLHGQPPLDLSRPLTWLDLGAASGISAAMVAATNPEMDVWGFDHNPGHVDRARRLAATAELTNCHFEEASFAQLAADETLGPAQADVIVVSGVYSWVSQENQAHIVKVIERRLRPGGLAYVMYGASTGWTSMIPTAEALRLSAEADGRRKDLAFPHAAASIQELAAAGALAFPMGPREQSQMETWDGANAFYAAHEYLGSHFAPLTADQVIGRLAEARCSYLGQLDASDLLRDFWAPPGLADLVTGTADVTTREMLRDLIGQRPLRRDLYRRGLAVTNPAEHRHWLDQLQIRGLGKAYREEPVDIMGGQLTLDPAYYIPLVGALQHEPLGLDTIAAIHTDWTEADSLSALCLLVAAGYAAPARTPEASAATRASSNRLNRALAAENRRGHDHGAVMAPALGAAVSIDAVQLMALDLIWSGADADPMDLAVLLVEELYGQGRMVREDSSLVESRDEALSVVQRRIEDLVIQRAGHLAALGVD